MSFCPFFDNHRKKISKILLYFTYKYLSTAPSHSTLQNVSPVRYQVQTCLGSSPTLILKSFQLPIEDVADPPTINIRYDFYLICKINYI